MNKKITSIIRGNIIFISTVLLLCVFQSACITSYFPNSRNIPLLEEQGQMNFGAGLSRAGLEAQTSLALSNHIGIIASGTFFNSESFEDDPYFLKNYNADIGIGYFQKSDWLLTEIYGGYGLGYLENSVRWTEPFDDLHIYAQYQKIFLSPNIGMRWDYFELGFSLRTTYVDYDFLNDSNPYSSQNSNIYNIIFEPAAVIKVRVRNFKYYVQGGINNLIITNQVGIFPQYYSFSTGFEYNIGKLFGK